MSDQIPVHLALSAEPHPFDRTKVRLVVGGLEKDLDNDTAFTFATLIRRAVRLNKEAR